MPGGTLTLAGHLQDLHAVRRSRLHRLPQALLLGVQLAVMPGPDQQLRSLRGGGRGLKQLVEIGLAVAHAHQCRARTMRLNFGHRLVALGPLVAFLLLDRPLVAL